MIIISYTFLQLSNIKMPTLELSLIQTKPMLYVNAWNLLIFEAHQAHWPIWQSIRLVILGPSFN